MNPSDHASFSAEQGFPATKQRLGLYPVVDSLLWIERLLAVGVTTIQLRIKDLADAQVEQDIAAAIELGKRYQARLFINDYWRLAIKHGAYGVHLGQEDLETTDLAAIQQAGLRLGVSTHDGHELAIAKAVRPSYIAMGHIFPTQTKQMPSSLRGWQFLNKWLITPLITPPSLSVASVSRASLRYWQPASAVWLWSVLLLKLMIGSKQLRNCCT